MSLGLVMHSMYFSWFQNQARFFALLEVSRAKRCPAAESRVLHLFFPGVGRSLVACVKFVFDFPSSHASPQWMTCMGLMAL